MTHQSRWFLPHPMAGECEPDEATRAATLVARADKRTMGLVDRCAEALQELTRQAGAVHFLTAAVQGAALEDGTPHEWLRRALDQLREETATVRAESAVAAQRARAEALKNRPFTDAIAKVAAQAQAAREGALRALSSLTGPNAAQGGTQATERWQQLVAAGLNQEQIRLVMPDLPQAGGEEERLAAAEKHRETMRQADTVLAAVRAYREDPLRRLDPLHGVCPELDAVLAAHAPAETEGQPA
jgi:hypothetical protein